jgi:predicted phage terminase large subunit-like protein
MMMQQEALADRSILEGIRYFCTGPGGLLRFIKWAWPQVEPAREFITNWHIEAIIEHLEAVTRGDIARLVINVPPGSMKSLSCCVFWPAWAWTMKPATKWIYASYSGQLSRRDSLRTRRLVESKWYQALWGHVWRPHPDEWGSTKFSNDQAGFRLATSVGGGVTGEHSDVQVVDDPIKPLEVKGAKLDSAAIASCLEWWDETMTTRLLDPAKSARVIIMQRLHERDLAGHVLKQGGYEHLCLPMKAEKTCVVLKPHKCSLGDNAPTSVGHHNKDDRTPGTILWPSRFDEAAVEQRARELGPRGAAAQEQQRPIPAGGGLFKREWVKFYKVLPAGLTYRIQSWDCAFKGAADSDFVAGQVWGMRGGEFYLIDQIRGQLTFSVTKIAMKGLSAKHPKAFAKLVEDKANGPAIIDDLKRDIPGLIAVNPDGGKEARANAVEPLWAAGNVWLPDPEIAPWIHDLIEELVNFPMGANDDQVDAMSQALNYLHKKSLSRYKEAMRNVL